MTRCYGDRYASELKVHIRKVKDLPNTHTYIISTADSTFSENYEARKSADTAARNASSKMTSVNDELQDLDEILERFFSHVDEVSEELKASTSNVKTILNSAFVSFDNLCEMLNGSKTVDDLKTNSVSDAFEPIKKMKNEYESELVKMIVRENGLVDDDAKKSFEYFMHKKGVTGLTSEDLENFSCIYKALLNKGHDHEWIMDRVEIIFASQWFDNIAVTGRYSSKDQTICINNLDEYLMNIDVDMCKYEILKKKLNPDDDTFDQLILEAFKKELSSRGFKNASEDKVRCLLYAMNTLSDMGASDKLLYDNLDFFSEEIDPDINLNESSSQSQIFKNMAVDFINKKLVDLVGEDTEHSRKYLETFKSNTSEEERIEILNYIDRVERGERIEFHEKTEFLMKFSKCFLGYQDEVSFNFVDNRINHFTYFGEHYHDREGRSKQSYDWCAMFVCWMLDKSGFLDGSILEGVTGDNAVPNYCLAGTSNFLEQFKNIGAYTKHHDPKICDLVLFREYHEDDLNYYHMGIVVGVDDDKIYTIEGNSGVSRNTNETLPHKICLNSYDKDFDRIGGYCIMGGNEEGTKYIQEEIDNNLVRENDDRRSMYLSCSENFVADEEY